MLRTFFPVALTDTSYVILAASAILGENAAKHVTSIREAKAIYHVMYRSSGCMVKVLTGFLKVLLNLSAAYAQVRHELYEVSSCLT